MSRKNINFHNKKIKTSDFYKNKKQTRQMTLMLIKY